MCFAFLSSLLVASFRLQALMELKSLTGWLNATAATRGSTERAWASRTKMGYQRCITARSADLTSTPTSSSALLPRSPLDSDSMSSTARKHHARRARQSSASHHATTNAARNSRSHSPTYLLKQPPKRRNTMNSRDAAYELEVQMLLEATKVEAAAEASVIPQEPLVASPPTMNGQAAEVDDKSRDGPEQEVDNSNGRKKRKRSSDDR